MNSSYIKIFNIILKPFTSLIIRRFLAFFTDILILLLFAVLLAFLEFSFDMLKGIYQYYLVLYLGYFISIRFILDGNTIGMRVTKTSILVNNRAFKSLKVFYRTLLNFTFLFSFLNFYPIISFMFPFIDYDSQIKVLVIVSLLSIPLLNLILILQTKGYTSLIDTFSKCSIIKKNHNQYPSKNFIFSFRKIIGEYLITISIVYLLALLIFWKFQPERIFNRQVLSPLFENPIEKLNLQDYFSKYTDNNTPVIAYVSEDYNFLSPYPFIKGKDTFVLYVFLKRDIFNDKNQHSLLISDALYVKNVYEQFYQKEIPQCKVIIRKYGFFPPFTFISDYKYLAIGEDKNYMISGDMDDELKKKKREEYFNTLTKIDVGDTLEIELSYPTFSETKPNLDLMFNVSSGLQKSPGLGFYFVGNKFEEFGQL